MVLSTDGGSTFGAPTLVTPVTLYAPPSIRSGAFLRPRPPTARLQTSMSSTRLATPPLSRGFCSRNQPTPAPAGRRRSRSPIMPEPESSIPPSPRRPTGRRSQSRSTISATAAATPSLCNLYLAQSFDGGTTWQPNIRLTSETTDASLAPLTSEGYMLGDYLGIAPTTGPDVPAVPVWVDTRTGNADPLSPASASRRKSISPASKHRVYRSPRSTIRNSAGHRRRRCRRREQSLGVSLRDRPNDSVSVLFTSRQLNISTREMVGTGDNVLIGGLIVSGSTPKQVSCAGSVLRSPPPGSATCSQDPSSKLHDDAGALILVERRLA